MRILARKTLAMQIITRRLPNSPLPSFDPNDGSPTRKNVVMYALEKGWNITDNMHCITADTNNEENDVAMTAAYWGREVEDWMLIGRNPDQMNIHDEVLIQNDAGNWVL